MCEILAPAGDEASFKAAINAGADAVYLGLRDFSARKGAANFSAEELAECAARAHVFGAKVYVALNTLVKDGELQNFFACAREAWNAGADALILQDVFLGRLLKRTYPEMVLHLSTQAGVCNVYGARLAKRCGFSRVILARETPLGGIAAIAREIETEVFVQGALCTCFSGQCYLSSLAGGNSGNRGLCKQPCRKLYAADRDGFREPCYFLSPSDLCVGEDVRRLREAGVASFKIEGRMRSAAYVAAATAYYKDILRGEGARLGQDLSRLQRAFNRGGYTRGLAFGQDAGFLSQDVQGHIGECVGRVGRCSKNDRYAYILSAYRPREGDGFKFLRREEGGRERKAGPCEKAEGGARPRLREVGGGVWRASCPQYAQGFSLAAVNGLRAGDLVCLTSEASPFMEGERRLPVHIKVFGRAGAPLRARAEGGGASFSALSDLVLQAAEGCPLRADGVAEIFQKAGEYPFAVRAEVELEGACFAARSQLNAFRRALLRGLYAELSRPRPPLPPRDPPVPAEAREGGDEPSMAASRRRGGALSGGRIAVIDRDFSDPCYRDAKIDIAVFQPKDAAKDAEFQEFCRLAEYYAWHKLLYFPAFMTDADLKTVESRLPLFDGVYAEGAFAVEFCRERGLPLFAGTGFNLFNAASVRALCEEECVRGLALSKELSAAECARLRAALPGGTGALPAGAEGRAPCFVFAGGRVRAMELGHCPFGKGCAACDRRDGYTLTDEAGRRFPLLRSRLSDCRFVLYNCAVLAAEAEGDRVYDLSAVRGEEKAVCLRGGRPQGATAGAYKSGVR